MKSQNINYMPKLDHLRFFAALLVTVYHYYHFQSWGYVGEKVAKQLAKNSSSIGSAVIIEGHTGVALFLVLSGFIFTAISFGREINYRSFLMNRVLRIMPVYVLVIFIAAGFSHASLSQLISSLLFLPSAGVNYEPMTPHLWTIGLEFQFYLLFPFLVGFLHKYGLRYGLGLILLFTLIRASTWCFHSAGSIMGTAYYTLLGRLDQFLLGMMAGAIYSGRSRVHLPKWLGNPLCLLGAIILTIAVLNVFHRLGGYTNLGTKNGLWIFWTTLEGGCWALVILCYLMTPFDWPPMVSRSLAFLGTLSYSMYVCHWEFVHEVHYYNWLPQLSTSLTGNALLSVLLIVLPVLTAFTWLVFLLIERPFFELRKSYLIKRHPHSPTK